MHRLVREGGSRWPSLSRRRLEIRRVDLRDPSPRVLITTSTVIARGVRGVVVQASCESKSLFYPLKHTGHNASGGDLRHIPNPLSFLDCDRKNYDGPYRTKPGYIA